MYKRTLKGCRVLVVEDEYMLADEVAFSLLEAGATVLGPASSLEQALMAIKAEQCIDAAILDANLQGQMAFPAADLLLLRGIPFVFTTGYDKSEFPARFENIYRSQKPIDMAKITRAIGK